MNGSIFGICLATRSRPSLAARRSEQEGRQVTEVAAWQRVSRGARLLEQAIRSRTMGGSSRRAQSRSVPLATAVTIATGG